MKYYIRILFAILALSALNRQLSTANAQGTAFTYQGQLQNNGSPANGTYNLTFTLFATNSGGTDVAGPVTNSAVAISNGLFTVTIDFGSSVWNGHANWLQIGVETNNATSVTTLAPRQQITPAPYAIAAESMNGTLPASQLTSIGIDGPANFFVGPSGNATTSGSYNTANGVSAFHENTSGSANTANGCDALLNNTSGSDNTANGFEALSQNTSGSYNTADGSGALSLYSSGSFNIALGFQAGFNISTGSSNIDIGNQGAFDDNNIIRIGSSQAQTFIAGVINGDGGGLTDLSASQLTSIGNNNGGVGNFFVGPSGNATTSGEFNTANGYQALFNNTSGYENTANGGDALLSNTSGSYNTANGADALDYNTTGSWNTADGVNALVENKNGFGNTANGYQTLFNNTSGNNNIALGYQAGFNIATGSDNIDIGNEGSFGDNNIIRIGSGQTQAFIAGVISGDGSGLSGVGLLSGGNTFNGTQTFTNGTVYSWETVINRPANSGWTAVDEFDDISGSAFRGFVGMDGVGLTGNTNQMYVGTYTSHQLALYTADAPRMIITPTGNVGIGNANPANLLVVGTGGAYCDGTTWVNGSDRNSKQDFSLVNPRSVLAKVAAMPITEWQYKIEPGLEHIGPMAQDFHAAFGLNGSDDKHISTVDEGGVALAAIQGLNQKLEEQAKEKDAENAELKRENNLLATRLDNLEAEVKALAQKN